MPSLHFIVQFEPKPGCEVRFREALERVAGPSRAEPGCRGFQVFESRRAPVVFAIHSEWVDEAAFDRHASLPHTVEFLAAAREWLTHDVRGTRLRAL
ncbi:MAG: antibiotic biosynthesis monooxygenase [Acidobacteria bacterium]|nr:antibiotic biosynthesis monooxygenase [Acidobacteriota bacterium]